MTVWKHIQAVALLPFMVTVVIPVTILHLTGLDGMAIHRPVPWNLLMLAGAVLSIGLGLSLVVTTIRMFFQIGRGTLAPWNPTERLVVVGVYRHVRNPMITGVFCILLGEAVFFGSVPVLVWFAIFVVVNLIYIPLFEEPGLGRRFGGDYTRYRENVPRWIPRLTPWQPTGDRPDREQRR